MTTLSTASFAQPKPWPHRCCCRRRRRLPTKAMDTLIDNSSSNVLLTAAAAAVAVATIGSLNRSQVSDDSGISFTSDGLQNTSTTSSRISIYSADEQVIRQRGRRSTSQIRENISVAFQKTIANSTTTTTTTSTNTNLCNITNNNNNDSTHIEPLQPHNRSKYTTQIKDLKQQQQAGIKRKSLLRTPVKKRLRRHASILSQVRQSNRRRSGWCVQVCLSHLSIQASYRQGGEINQILKAEGGWGCAKWSEYMEECGYNWY